MATSLSRALALVAALQTPSAPVAPDALALLRARLERDSTDPVAWLALGREYLERARRARAAAAPPAADPASRSAALDTAERAFVRAAALFGPPGASAPGDSARVLRVAAWSRRVELAWETSGLAAGPELWGPLPADLWLPPVLEELGENLLRACPTGGVLLTASDADSYAAWYMRFERGLRPDLLVVALAAWRSDVALRTRLARDLRLRRGGADAWLAELVERRLVCASMAFERPPEARGRVRWSTRPLVWVAGPQRRGERVSPRDFGFAALHLALEQGDAWAAPALALYARAARATAALCEPLETFQVAGDVAACRR